MQKKARFTATVKIDNQEKDLYFTNKTDLINFVMEQTFKGEKVTWKPVPGIAKQEKRKKLLDFIEY